MSARLDYVCIASVGPGPHLYVCTACKSGCEITNLYVELQPFLDVDMHFDICF